MRFLVLTASILALAACQREEPKPVANAPPAAATPAAPAAQSASRQVEGWQTDPAAYPLLGQTIPKFSAKLNGGGEATQEQLRNHWTVVAFWGLWSDDSVADSRYIQALVSAIDADPNLDFLSIHIPPALGKGQQAFGAFKSLNDGFKAQGTKGWPTAIDESGQIAEDFKIIGAPIYLLVGPDLTVEGWRTELSATPDDGIKSVVRGVAQIKKQIAAPE